VEHIVGEFDDHLVPQTLMGINEMRGSIYSTNHCVLSLGLLVEEKIVKLLVSLCLEGIDNAHQRM
jgi:hypothetical protein